MLPFGSFCLDKSESNDHQSKARTICQHVHYYSKGRLNLHIQFCYVFPDLGLIYSDPISEDVSKRNDPPQQFGMHQKTV